MSCNGFSVDMSAVQDPYFKAVKATGSRLWCWGTFSQVYWNCAVPNLDCDGTELAVRFDYLRAVPVFLTLQPLSLWCLIIYSRFKTSICIQMHSYTITTRREILDRSFYENNKYKLNPNIATKILFIVLFEFSLHSVAMWWKPSELVTDVLVHLCISHSVKKIHLS